MHPRMLRLLKEPLLHFTVIGALIFLFYSRGPLGTGSEAPEVILISLGKTEQLKTGFSRAWQRPPTDAELGGLIQDYIREEVYVREAKAYGLGEDDVIIRRRLHQKLEFMSQDIARLAEPSEADLNTLLTAEPARFRAESRLSFEHIYLNPEVHGEKISVVVDTVKASLQEVGVEQPESENSRMLGDPFLLANRFDRIASSEITKQWGPSFLLALEELPLNQWQGPIESPFGTHMVRVSEKIEGHAPDLAEVRAEVRSEWLERQRRQANEDFYKSLRSRYTVKVEAEL